MSEQIVASRMMLAVFKGKTGAAKKGHELLKRKVDALKAKFRETMIGLLETKKKMGDETQDALFWFAKAQYAAGDFSQKVKDSVKRASIRVDLGAENIVGVQLPNCSLKEIEDSDSNISQIGIDKGGQAIMRCREKFKDLLVQLVRIASLQTSFFTLDEVIKVTNRRVNALEYVVIPRFIGIQVYINQELEEQDREDLYRIKKVLDQRKRLQAETDYDNEQRLKVLDAQQLEDKQKKLAQQSMFDEQKDQDVIF